jgi:hypothetical protein
MLDHSFGGGMAIMNPIAISATLDNLLARYKELQRICSHYPGNHVLGSASDAAASVFATHLFEIIDRDLSLQLSATQRGRSARCKQGRDSIALIPAVTVLAEKASVEKLADALYDGMWTEQSERPHDAQTIDEAKHQLDVLLTATQAAHDELSCAAREQGSSIAKRIFQALPGAHTTPFVPTELDRATDA